MKHALPLTLQNCKVKSPDTDFVIPDWASPEVRQQLIREFREEPNVQVIGVEWGEINDWLIPAVQLVRMSPDGKQKLTVYLNPERSREELRSLNL